MPEDFPEHARESVADLAKRYHAGQAAITRWKELCGTHRPKTRAVICEDADGRQRRFSSITEAARQTMPGNLAQNVSKILSAIRRYGTSGGYWWRYAEERDDRPVL